MATYQIKDGLTKVTRIRTRPTVRAGHWDVHRLERTTKRVARVATEDEGGDRSQREHGDDGERQERERRATGLGLVYMNLEQTPPPSNSLL